MYEKRALNELSPYVREVGLYAEIYPYVKLTPHLYRQSWENSRRKIYDFHFILCTRGEFNVIIEDVNYRLGKGSLVIIPPNTSHSFGTDIQENNGLYWFMCDLFDHEDKAWFYEFYNNPESYISLFNRPLDFKDKIRTIPIFEDDFRLPRVTKLDELEEAKIIFTSIYNEYISQNKNWQFYAKPLVLQLIALIIKQTEHGNTSENNRNKMVYQMKQYIAENYFKQISIKEICASTGLNHEYASKVFKKQMGMKPVTYLTKFRIDKSKSLFLEYDLRINEISDMVGFKNETYFATMIKKYEGKTPTQLRKYLMGLYNHAL